MVMDLTQSSQGHQDAVIWFTKYQLQSVINNGVVPPWFHGIISRKTAEDLLMPKPPGYFLIRVSESRIGYTVSYRAEDRFRHFMIDALQDGRYEIVGENKRHDSLQDLVDYHRKVPIMPFNQLLTVACGQSSTDVTNYAELLFSQKNPKPSNLLIPHTSPQAAEEEEDIPPALPYRPDNLTSSTVFPPNKLYPCLDVEFTEPETPFPAMPAPMTRRRYVTDNPPANHPPEAPSRSSVPPKLNQVCTRTVSPPDNLPTACEQAVVANNQPGKHQEEKLSVVANLRNLKKKFQKKRSNSQDATCAEVHMAENVHVENAENPYETIDLEWTDKGLPREYFKPPPFAPGH
ncbi:unnamed protein product [Ophioblennius macclurei]